MKQKWKDLFYFSKQERNTAAVLAVILLLFLVLPPLYRHYKTKAIITAQKRDSSPLRKAADTPEDTTATASELFVFDPNTADLKQFLQLGINEKTANTIIHYRAKGGKFRRPEDLLKIYGMSPLLAEKLMPYIQIKQNFISFRDNSYSAKFSSARPPKNKKSLHFLDMNKADTAAWASLPGIGATLSTRIVKYRTKIGGFKNIEDLKNVFGLPEDTYKALSPYLKITTYKAENPMPHSPQGQTGNKTQYPKININKATEADFKKNRSIPTNVAKAIIIYREQHGPYTSVSDVKKIIFINEDLFRQIAPYLLTED